MIPMQKIETPPASLNILAILCVKYAEYITKDVAAISDFSI